MSLDQLRQGKLALEYYRKALALAEKSSASFAPESARTRVQQLRHPCVLRRLLTPHHGLVQHFALRTVAKRQLAARRRA